MILRDVEIIGASSIRIPNEQRNKDYFYYDVRDDNGTPVRIQRVVWVNHWGTIITNKPITKDWDDGVLYLDKKESNLINEALSTLYPV